MIVSRLGVVVVVLTLTLGLLVSTSSQPSRPVPNLAIDHNVAIVTGQATRQPHEQMISGGVVDDVKRAREAESGQSLSRAAESSAPEGVSIRTVGCSQVFHGAFDNIKVNQDCTFRVHSEEFLVVDPNDPDHLVAGANDRRIGVNHCSIAYSFDRGRTWGDLIPPFWEFPSPGARKLDHASDPALAMDSRSNTYFTCVVFSDPGPESAILVTKSNAAFGGAFFHTPKPGPTQRFRTLPLGVVVNDRTFTLFHDKEFIFSDANPASPKRDNVYVTWTRFRMDATGNTTLESPIFYSQSTNGGATWSPSGGVEISGASSACVGGNAFDPTLPANDCNFDQGSWLVTGPDGTLYVFFINGNTPHLVGQQMMVKCPGSADCTKQASWTKPVKIVNDFDTQPFGPDAVTGCNGGRQCLPPNGYRVNDFGAAGLDPNLGANGRLYFTWADFRNGGPCAGTPDFPVPPCANYNNDVFLVTSDDGGKTWSAPTLVSGGSGTQAAQWQPWIAVGPDGIVYVAYYDRQYGSCESTGCNDITLATSTDHGKTFKQFRITTGSMPNLTPATTPTEAGFLGDYMNVQANSRGAYIIWGDTRPHAGTTPEESIFFAFFPRETAGGMAEKGDD
jgi:hypothetical protein